MENGNKLLEKAKENIAFARVKVRNNAVGKGNGVAGLKPGGEVATRGDMMDSLSVSVRLTLPVPLGKLRGGTPNMEGDSDV
jgi:hypothetical protein